MSDSWDGRRSPSRSRRSSRPASSQVGRLAAMRPLAIAASFPALAFVLTWRLWTPVAGDRRWVQAGDFQDQFYPFAAYLAAELRGGRLPLWNPFVFGGHPF